MKLSQVVYYAYIVECSDGKYYTGKTKDLDNRVKQHNGLLAGGAKYTEQRRPVKLVHYERCATNASACHREAEIKSLTHQQKKQLIEGL